MEVKVTKHPKPLNDRIVVIPLEEEKSSVILTDKKTSKPTKGTVVAVSEELKNDHTVYPPMVGEVVVWPLGQGIELEDSGQSYVTLSIKELLVSI